MDEDNEQLCGQGSQAEEHVLEGTNLDHQPVCAVKMAHCAAIEAKLICFSVVHQEKRPSRTLSDRKVFWMITWWLSLLRYLGSSQPIHFPPKLRQQRSPIKDNAAMHHTLAGESFLHQIAEHQYTGKCLHMAMTGSLQGKQYWADERRLCKVMLGVKAGSMQHLDLDLQDVHTTSEAKSFDYRVQCCTCIITFNTLLESVRVQQQ